MLTDCHRQINQAMIGLSIKDTKAPGIAHQEWTGIRQRGKGVSSIVNNVAKTPLSGFSYEEWRLIHQGGNKFMTDQLAGKSLEERKQHLKKTLEERGASRELHKEELDHKEGDGRKITWISGKGQEKHGELRQRFEKLNPFARQEARKRRSQDDDDLRQKHRQWRDKMIARKMAKRK